MRSIASVRAAPARRSCFFVLAFLAISSATSLKAQEVEDAAVTNEEKKGFLAQMKDPEDGRFDISQFLLDNLVGFLPIPLIITEPAVDNGIRCSPAPTT